jgi:pSer/pThr/pTyr-binding forkhead associated (FHA) protein
MGRGHQCDLRISDISVSRVHALLRYKEGQFLLFDNESKFGTLIHLNNNYQIHNDKAAIQIGRTVFTFVLKYLKSTPVAGQS